MRRVRPATPALGTTGNTVAAPMARRGEEPPHTDRHKAPYLQIVWFPLAWNFAGNFLGPPAVRANLAKSVQLPSPFPHLNMQSLKT